ncbi:MAG TPA: NADH-quinone oxidoreductase subunit G, partial [Nocardioides sp.]|nr:NADH-quinone oxidoreductase subunit G [Nocardioides sp.]
VTLTIDGRQVTVARGRTVLQAAIEAGIKVPYYCYHPALGVDGSCRVCLVKIEKMPKLQVSCSVTATEGMVVQTATKEVEDARAGVFEFLLINHPLDCPVCDKGGECPLQNQAMSNGRGESRFEGVKRTFPKPINISAQVLLDRERCVLCARCTRFSEQIAGDPFIALVERGALQQVGIYEKEPFESYFSGNTIQICPVGALTSADYRFRSRPFDLVSSPSVAEHDACGSAIRVDHRRGKVMRRLSGNDPEVNEEWITDKDHFAFQYAQADDRLRYPMVRDEAGELRPASWPEAFAVAARGLRDAGTSAVLTGGRLTAEDAYAYSKFARLSLGTNDIDFRSRPLSEEEASFLASEVVLRRTVSYADLETAATVVLAGFEPEDEAGAIFLRLRKGSRRGTRVVSVAPYASRGLQKMNGQLLPTVPGEEAATLDSLVERAEFGIDKTAVILVGERLATSPGALTAAASLAKKTGARLAWVPRRAGDRGALETGCLPNLLPGGRPVADTAARVDAAAAWGVDSVPSTAGRDADAIVAALVAGEIGGLVIGGVDPDDTADPAATRAAIDAADFVVSLELRETDVTRAADVVLPVAPVTDKAGTFVNWEGRLRQFDAILGNPGSLPDLRVLAGIAEELAGLGAGHRLGFRTVDEARAQMEDFGGWDGDRATLDAPGRTRASKSTDGLVLATWKQMIDNGSMQDGDEHMRATARISVARVPAEVYDAVGPIVKLTGDRGSVTLPAEIADIADGTVWVPANSFKRGVLADLASPGSRVTVTGGNS